MKSFTLFLEDEEFEALHPRDKFGRFAKKREKKDEDFSDEELDYYYWKINYGFPNCNRDNSYILGRPSENYNCIGFAFGDKTRWWWPGDEEGMYWPEQFRAETEEESFANLLDFVEAERVDSEEPEKGYVKVAMYTNHGEITHMSRLTPDGAWASKVGADVLLEHEFDALNSGSYGTPKVIFRIPIENFKKLRDME